ncbi:McrB family protein [Methylococcus geothermalis]|uniref:AAA domain-containing protein n=1 Tax=Methylococcus geothermalis TaxID=2681310 RepID=A0A858Q5H4_9GAMM|nr:AAA family ATPase [Methylococcus geothermalis]QJD29033.1 AAA domain-containing protein [Methylococcus geothermalis]
MRLSTSIISRYVLSLKSKPLVILSGISGTGKTKIAQLFAEYMLQNETEEEKEKRLAFVSVRPDWTDNRGLLGYYNLLDQRYYTTKVLRLLIEAEKHPDKPYFIILDEMNLAKVEHYFSDFLSVMESRTAGNPKGERIELHGIRNHKVLAIESTETDPIPIPAEIHIPNNVYFTGTVNVDETTYMFSPKVLDRANVIEFNEVSFSPSDPILGNFRLKSDQQEVLNWFHEAETTFCSLDDFRKAAKEHPRFSETVNALKNLLEPFHLHFGYRVANEMARFILLAVKHVGAEHLNDAIDIQILQKVLPKFHGTQGKLEEPLKTLNAFCETSDFARSAKKLQRMLKDLSDQGYCSFIA